MEGGCCIDIAKMEGGMLHRPHSQVRIAPQRHRCPDRTFFLNCLTRPNINVLQGTTERGCCSVGLALQWEPDQPTMPTWLAGDRTACHHVSDSTGHRTPYVCHHAHVAFFRAPYLGERSCHTRPVITANWGNRVMERCRFCHNDVSGSCVEDQKGNLLRNLPLIIVHCSQACKENMAELSINCTLLTSMQSKYGSSQPGRTLGHKGASRTRPRSAPGWTRHVVLHLDHS
jgi:hypothetical protein